MLKKKQRATELEYLYDFYCSADFGPADGDVRLHMRDLFISTENKLPPEGYYCCDECGKDLEGECKCQ